MSSSKQLVQDGNPSLTMMLLKVVVVCVHVYRMCNMHRVAHSRVRGQLNSTLPSLTESISGHCRLQGLSPLAATVNRTLALPSELSARLQRRSS